jgi:hypothetical protein
LAVGDCLLLFGQQSTDNPNQIHTMGILNRFFGKPDEDGCRGEQLLANPNEKSKVSLQILFKGPLSIETESLKAALQKWHSEMKKAACEFDSECVTQGTPLGLVGWADHVVKLVGFNTPIPEHVLERCVKPSNFKEDFKQNAYDHQSHLILWYAGYEVSRVEQFVALAAVAAVLASFGASVVLNEKAHSCFPAAALSGTTEKGDRMELLRTLPLLILYGGFVKYEVEKVSGIWMRTHGLHILGLPDLAILTRGHYEAELAFETSSNVLSYVAESEAKLAAGHTMQVGKDYYLRLRLPHKDENFLDSEGDIFVAELISSDEINR